MSFIFQTGISLTPLSLIKKSILRVGFFNKYFNIIFLIKTATILCGTLMGLKKKKTWQYICILLLRYSATFEFVTPTDLITLNNVLMFRSLTVMEKLDDYCVSHVRIKILSSIIAIQTRIKFYFKWIIFALLFHLPFYSTDMK